MALPRAIVEEIVKIPEVYLCPITKKMMIDPVIAEDGYIYEREAIEEWLKTHDTSPKKNEKLRHKDLRPNLAKKQEIDEFLTENPGLYEGDKLYLPKSWVNQLVAAIKANQIKEVQELLTKDRRLLTLKLEGGYTAFHLACQFASPELANILLESLIKRNQLDKISGQPPIPGFKPTHLNALLEKSLLEADNAKCSLLLKLGAELNQLEAGTQNTLLHKLVAQGKFEAINWLLDQGLKIDSENAEGNTPLLLAVAKGDGYKVDRTALCALVAKDQKEMKEKAETVKLLLDAGANPLVVWGAEKLTLLHLAARQGDLAVLKLLLSTKAATLIDAGDIRGDTALHLAAQAGRDNVIPALLEAEADHELRNTQGQTPAELAREKNKPETARLIEQTARTLRRARREEIERLRQLSEQQAKKIEQLEKELTQIKQRMEPEIKRKEEALAPSASPPFTPLRAASAERPRPKATAEDIQTFLNHVVAGRQDEAEAMLKANRELALASGTVTDHAKRTFRDITGFQYAVWALDWHMWKMIKQYLEVKEAKEQAEGFGQGSWVKEHGECVSWKKLTDAQRTLIDNLNQWDWKKIDEFWVQQIGGAQLLLPMHVLQEYYHPTRPFDPLPAFEDGTLARTAVTQAVVRRLGTDLVIERGCRGREGPLILMTISADPLFYIEHDMPALVKLMDTRTQQRRILVADLAPAARPTPPI